LLFPTIVLPLMLYPVVRMVMIAAGAKLSRAMEDAPTPGWSVRRLWLLGTTANARRTRSAARPFVGRAGRPRCASGSSRRRNVRAGESRFSSTGFFPPLPQGERGQAGGETMN
jgi:hypothetical protein